MNLKYNFSALKMIEKNGINIRDLEDGISIEKLGIVFWAGLYGANKSITLDESEEMLNSIVEEMGLEKGLEHISSKINEAMSEKK